LYFLDCFSYLYRSLSTSPSKGTRQAPSFSSFTIDRHPLGRHGDCGPLSLRKVAAADAIDEEEEDESTRITSSSAAPSPDKLTIMMMMLLLLLLLFLLLAMMIGLLLVEGVTRRAAPCSFPPIGMLELL